MYLDLNDFLQINGLQSVTILFNVISKYQNGSWQMMEDSEGFKILTRLRRQKGIRIAEADFTRWGNEDEQLMDTYYAASVGNLFNKDYSTIRQIVVLTLQIKKEFANAQIYINNFYELNGETSGLVKYTKVLGQIY